MPEPEQPPSSADDLLKSLRAIVHEELQKPTAPAVPAPAESRPDGWDLFWLLVLAGDAALVFSWFPEDAKGPLEFLKDFAPWLLGGTFVVLNNWFRDTLLRWIRFRWMRVFQAALLLGGLCATLKVVSIKPVVLPEGTAFSTDLDEKSTPNHFSEERVWLTLRNHDVTLIPPEGGDAKPRQMEISWKELLQGEVTQLRMIYLTDIAAAGDSKEVAIHSEDGSFDGDFLQPRNLRKSDPPLTAVDSDPERKKVLFHSHGGVHMNTLWLPVGKYVLSFPGCERGMELKVVAKTRTRNFRNLADCGKTVSEPE